MQTHWKSLENANKNLEVVACTPACTLNVHADLAVRRAFGRVDGVEKPTSSVTAREG